MRWRGSVPELSALMLAAQYGDPNLVQMLLAAGASVKAKNKEGATALIFAIKGFSPDPGQIVKVRLLVQSGAEVNIETSEGETPLALARMLKLSEIVKLLEESQSRQ